MAYHPRPDDGLTATQRYHNKCDAITIRPRKEDGEKIRSAASARAKERARQAEIARVRAAQERQRAEQARMREEWKAAQAAENHRNS